MGTELQSYVEPSWQHIASVVDPINREAWLRLWKLEQERDHYSNDEMRECGLVAVPRPATAEEIQRETAIDLAQQENDIELGIEPEPLTIHLYRCDLIETWSEDCAEISRCNCEVSQADLICPCGAARMGWEHV